MTFNHFIRNVFGLYIVSCMSLVYATDISPIPLNTYSAPSSTDVKPNVFFILDDSGSMDWDYMPDWACAAQSTRNPTCNSAGQNPSSPRYEFWFRNASYNGSYYNPAVKYSPPLAVGANGAISDTTYLSQTGVSVATGGDANATTSTPNWKAVKDDAYGVQSSAATKSNLQSDVNKPPYFFTMIPGQFCTLPNLNSCIAANAATMTYKFPATVRWCTDSTYSNCRPTYGGSYTYARAPAPRTSTVTVSGNGASTNVTGITVGTKQILPSGIPSTTTITFSGANNASVANLTVNGLRIISANTASNSTNATVASRVAANINACTSAATGLCGTSGFSATASGSVVTIYDAASNTSFAPVVTRTGTLNSSTSNFSLPNTATDVAQAVGDLINKCTVVQTGNCTAVGFSATYSAGVITLTAPDINSSTPSISKTGMQLTATSFALPDANIPGENIRTTITPSVTSYAYPGTTSKAATRTDCAGTTCTYAEEMTNYANWWTYYKSRMQMMKTAASNAFLTIDNPTDRANDVSRFRLGYMSLNDNTNNDFVNLDEFKTSHKYLWYSRLIAANPSNSTPLRAALAKAGQLYGGKLNNSTLNGSTVTDPLQYSCQQNYTILSTDGFWNEGSGYTKLDGTTNVGNQDGGLDTPYSDGATAQQQSSTSTLQQRTGRLQVSTNNGRNWTNTNACQPNGATTQCRYSWGAFTNAASCNVNYSAGDGNWTISTGTDCAYTGWTQYANVSSCTAIAQSIAPNYTVATARCTACTRPIY